MLMTLSRILTSILVCLLVVSQVACTGTQDDGKTSIDLRPTRSDCMVRISPGSSRMVQKINPDTYFFMKTFRDRRIPVAAHSFDEEGGIYVLFLERCGERGALARELMTAFYAEGAEGFVYQTQGIISSTKTILVRGDHWSDGEDYGQPGH